MVYGILWLDFMGECSGYSILCWGLVYIFGRKVSFHSSFEVGFPINHSHDNSQPYMNWFMDTIGSTYGGGVFCAILNMGINVSPEHQHDTPYRNSFFDNISNISKHSTRREQQVLLLLLPNYLTIVVLTSQSIS